MKFCKKTQRKVSLAVHLSHCHSLCALLCLTPRRPRMFCALRFPPLRGDSCCERGATTAAWPQSALNPWPRHPMEGGRRAVRISSYTRMSTNKQVKLSLGFSWLWVLECAWFYCIALKKKKKKKRSIQVFCHAWYVFFFFYHARLQLLSACKNKSKWLHVEVHKSRGGCFKCVYENRAFSTPSSIHSVHPPLTSSVLVAEVREAPHVAQADDGAGHRQDELYLVAPLAPLLHLLLRGRQQVLGAIAEVCFGSVSCRRGGGGFCYSKVALEQGKNYESSSCISGAN